MRGLAHSPTGQRILEGLHLRIFARVTFSSAGTPCSAGWRTRPPLTGKTRVACLLSWVSSSRRASRFELARATGTDPSFLSKIVHGKKTPPGNLLETMETWVNNYVTKEPTAPVSGKILITTPSGMGNSLLATALSYVQAGLCVVPQCPSEEALHQMEGLPEATARGRRTPGVVPALARGGPCPGAGPGE